MTCRRLAFLLLFLAAAPRCWADSAQPHAIHAAPRRQIAAAAFPPPYAAAAKQRDLTTRSKSCAPEDTDCLALRDHICDPYYFANVSDTCAFVQLNKHCAEDVHHIAYLPLFYCRTGDGRVLVALFFLVWMGVLFWVMSKAAEDFLVPALEFLAHWMRMSPDVAGVTLFAFASGAPDLFTQIAAVAAGGNVDQELAIGATLGGGLFIIAVIFSVVVLVSKPPPGANQGADVATELTDRRAFVRDCLAYLVSTLALLGIMLRGVFAAWEACLLLLGYAAYLATCILTSKGAVAGHCPGVNLRHGYEAVSPSRLQQQQPLPQQQVEMQHVAVQGLGSGGGGAFSSSGAGQAGVQDGVITSPVAATLRQTELVSRPGSGQPLARKSADTSIGKRQQHQQQQQQQAEQQPGCSAAGASRSGELAILVGDLLLSDALPANGDAVSWQAPWHVKLGARSSSRLNKVLGSASLGLQEMLHIRNRSGPSLWLTLLMSPAMLLLHATMPAMHPGNFTPWYALVLSLGAPLFMLLSTGLFPHHLSTAQFMLTWLLTALALLTLLLLAVQPVGAANGSGVGVSGAGPPGLTASPNGSVTVMAVAAGSPLAPAAPSSPLGSPAGGIAGGTRFSRALSGGYGVVGSRARHLCTARRPRRSAVLAVLASVQCMLWLSVAADELVSLFEAIGRICDISQDLLGATILAWGEAVPELVATMTLAKQGHATTAISAVFGGPVFNILCAWAAPTLYATLRKDAPPYSPSGGVQVLVLFTVVVLVFTLVAIPLVFKWRLARRAAIAILGIYGLSQVLFLLAEEL